MKTKYIKQTIIGIALLSLTSYAKAQTNHSAAKPFLKASQDARSIALAGASTSSSADAYSIYSNASKSVLSEKSFQLGASFSQFRPTLSKDIRLYSAACYYNMGYNSSILAGFRYMRGIPLVAKYTNIETFSPYDYSVDLGYAYSPMENLSLAVVGSFADSKLLANTSNKDILFGLSATYNYKFSKGYNWTTAVNLSNLGFSIEKNQSEKIDENTEVNILNIFSSNKNDTEGSLPTTFVWGNTLSNEIIPAHKLSISADLISYLAPSEARTLEGAFAIEYTGFDILSLRGGYRLANEEKGSYSYFTSGIGLTLKGVSLDASYIIAGKDTPMQNAWWLTASFSL